jgi:hypothetical protein
MPGVYLAESLTEEIDGFCITSVVNTLERDVTIGPLLVELEEIKEECNDTALIFLSAEVNTEDRIQTTG